MESFITGRNRKKPRNKKRNETIKIQNIRKNVKFLEKKRKQRNIFCYIGIFGLHL
jgi:hypothetical protein